MSNDVMTPFARARAEKKLTLGEIAKAVDYDRGGLSRIERGVYRPRPVLASKLAEILGITRDQILFPEEYADPGKKPVSSAGAAAQQEAR